MTLSYTPRFHLAVPDFLSEPWHAEFAAAMESIDQALFTAIVAQETNQWLNDHAYLVGDLIIDPSTGTLYSCAVAHTSSNAAIAPTFAQEFAAHPTYWTSFAVIAASQTEAEQGTDNNKYMTPLRTAQAITAQSPTPGIATVAQAQEATNNTEIMTPLRVGQGITARIATQAEATAGTNNTQLMTPLRTEQLIVSAGVAGGDAIGFSAHKNGVTQSLTAATWTKVTFGAELYDSGSFYDTANSRWTPPSGQIHIDCGMDVAGHTIDTFVAISIYKNGSGFRSVNLYSPSTAAGATLSIDDIANGTDYYEMWAYIPSAGTPTILGGIGTFLMGAFLGEVGVVTMGLAEVGFRASKGGTNQTGIPNQVYTKMSFGTEEYDQGARYDPAISRWTPPTGLVSLTASMVVNGAIAVGGVAAVGIYKNGVSLKSGIDVASSGGIVTAQVSVDDIASGTDYYEAFAYVSTGGAAFIDGSAANTYFAGHRITGAQGEVGPTGPTGPTGSTVSPSINCGRLRYISPTQLSFTPFNGGHIKINGVLVPIPTSGIVGLTNSNAYVNGVAGQSLGAATVYYVYVFSNAGVLTADFSLTGHATSVALTNEGTEIKSGDNTRTLIGMIRTANGATTFIDNPQNRFVLSWFNRRSRPIKGPGTNTTIGVGSWTTINGASYCYFLTWGDEACDLSAIGYAWVADTGPAGWYGGFAIDQLTTAGAGLVSYAYQISPNIGWSLDISARDVADYTEGFHAFYPAGYAGSYTVYFNIWLTGSIQG
jgi:hypothetical protein